MSLSDKEKKKVVADAVFDGINTSHIERTMDVGDGPITVELSRVSDLQFSVRVKTQVQGTHYYLVKVSEQY